MFRIRGIAGEKHAWKHAYALAPRRRSLDTAALIEIKFAPFAEEYLDLATSRFAFLIIAFNPRPSLQKVFRDRGLRCTNEMHHEMPVESFFRGNSRWVIHRAGSIRFSRVPRVELYFRSNARTWSDEAIYSRLSRCEYAQAEAPRIDASQPIHQPPSDAAAKGNQWFGRSLQGRCPLVSDQARPARACPSFGASEGRTARSESARAIDLKVLLRAAAARLKITSGRTCRNLWANAGNRRQCHYQLQGHSDYAEQVGKTRSTFERISSVS